METKDNPNSSEIVNFYKGKSIFITGATGFIGTVLIEKLLYSCSDLGNIYVLMKPKHGSSVETRLKEMLKSPAFHRIQEHKPVLLKKIIPIEGSLEENNLGISENNISQLQNEVSIVFHLAASLSFAMELRQTINKNTKATENLVSICKHMHRLTAFVYVSSGYSQSNNRIIAEKVYETTVPLDEVYELINMPKSEKLAYTLLEGRPNVYAYSKALAEGVVARSGLPATIVRPTITLSAVKEPLPGWIKSWAGPTTIVEAARRGLLLCWYSDPENILDIVPVDYVSNFLIAAAWDTNKRGENGEILKETKVFNYTSFAQNPIALQQFIDICLIQVRKTCGIMTNTLVIVTKNMVRFWMIFILFDIIISIILGVMDTVYWMLGNKKRMLKFRKALARRISLLEFFTQNQFLVLNSNVRQLYESMSDKDKQLFEFDVRKLEWENYLRDYVIGIRKYNML